MAPAACQTVPSQAAEVTIQITQITRGASALTIDWLGRILCLKPDFDSVERMTYECHHDTTCKQAVDVMPRSG